MEKIFIKKENIQGTLSNLKKQGIFPKETIDSILEQVREKVVLDDQYLVLETNGHNVVVYNIHSSKVPLRIREEQGEKVDSAFYL